MKDRILAGFQVGNYEEFESTLSYFESSIYENERLSLYQDFLETHKGKGVITSLAEARHQILINVFGNYVNEEMQYAQETCERNIEVSNTLINQLSKLWKVVEKYEVATFKEYIATVVSDINPYEINAIFEQEITSLTSNDAVIVSDAIRKVFNAKPKFTGNYGIDYVNHPLTNLLCIPRSKELDEKLFGKYAKLAKYIQQYRIAHQTENFDGAISYLIFLDMEYGLENVVEPKEVAALIKNINNSNSDESALSDVAKLMTLSKENSTNFIEGESGDLKKVNSDPLKSKAIGMNDSGHFSEKYNRWIYTHTVSSLNEGSQVGRVSKITAKNTSIPPVSIQIGTNAPVGSYIGEINTKKILSPREQMIVSYAHNFAFILSYVSKEKDLKSINVFEHGPVEIYVMPEQINASQSFITDLLSLKTSEEKILEFSQSLISVINKMDVLSLPYVSTEPNNPRYTFVIDPLFSIAQSLLRIYDQNNDDRFKQVYSNMVHLLNDHKDALLNVGNEFKSNAYENFFDSKKPLLSVSNPQTYLLSKNPEVSLDTMIDKYSASEDKIKAGSELVKFINKYGNESNGSSLSFIRMSQHTLNGLESLPEEMKQQLLPVYNVIALRDIENIRKKSSLGRKVELSTASNIIDGLTSKRLDDRYVIGSPSENKPVYDLFNDTYENDGTKQATLIVYSRLAKASGAVFGANVKGAKHYTSKQDEYVKNHTERSALHANETNRKQNSLFG